MEFPLKDPVFIFTLILVINLSSLFLAGRLRIPPLILQIIMGAIVGTNGLGILARDDRLIMLEKIGLLYIMLMAGVQLNLSNFQKLGIRALVFGLMTFGIPLGIGIVTGQALSYTLLGCLLLGILYSPHTLMSYPIVASMGLAGKESVAVGVGGSAVTTLLTLSAYAIVKAIQSGNVGMQLYLNLLIYLPLLIAASFWIFPKLGHLMIEKYPKNVALHYLYVLTSMFVCASATNLLGVDGIVGAFVAGLALNSIVPNDSELMEKLVSIANMLFIPAFAISIGVLSNLGSLFANINNMGIVLLVIGGAALGKFLAAWIAGKLFSYDFPSIMVIFGLTVSRAALVLVIALFGKDAGLLSENVFNAIIVYIMVTCLFGPMITTLFAKKLDGVVEAV